MVERSGSARDTFERVDLIDIEPPGTQTDITWKAIQEGLREIFWPDIDGEGNPAMVILPHRIQAIFVCRMCSQSVVVKYYTADAIRGHVTITRRCECGGEMYRRFLGADRDVPVEMEREDSGEAEGLDLFLVDEEEHEDIDDSDEEFVILD